MGDPIYVQTNNGTTGTCWAAPITGTTCNNDVSMNSLDQCATLCYNTDGCIGGTYANFVGYTDGWNNGTLITGTNGPTGPGLCVH